MACINYRGKWWRLPVAAGLGICRCASVVVGVAVRIGPAFHGYWCASDFGSVSQLPHRRTDFSASVMSSSAGTWCVALRLACGRGFASPEGEVACINYRGKWWSLPVARRRAFAGPEEENHEGIYSD